MPPTGPTDSRRVVVDSMATRVALTLRESLRRRLNATYARLSAPNDDAHTRTSMQRHRLTRTRARTDNNSNNLHALSTHPAHADSTPSHAQNMGMRVHARNDVHAHACT